MVAGTPVIATDVGGKRILNHKNGTLIKLIMNLC